MNPHTQEPSASESAEQRFEPAPIPNPPPVESEEDKAFNDGCNIVESQTYMITGKELKISARSFFDKGLEYGRRSKV